MTNEQKINELADFIVEAREAIIDMRMNKWFRAAEEMQKAIDVARKQIKELS